MNRIATRSFGLLAFVSIVVSSSASAAPVDYLRDVKPLLKNKCYSCHVSDLHATILHLMGLDHRKLTCSHQGLDQRLTGVVREASIIRKALA